ncbi:MAG: hypothetical protein AB1Z16_14095 [Desulfotignum sp.]
MKLDVTKTMANAKEMMTEGAFQQAGSVLSQAKNMAREEAQKKSSPEIKKILNKLQSDEQISAEEIALIKAWIVGDASEYTKMENNFQDWVSEYERLQKSLASYENKDCSFKELLMLHGILEDATRVSYDIANFLENKERIRKFESAVGDGIDAREREILANVLIGKLQSPDA